MRTALFTLAGFLFVSSARADCYGANTTSFSWCKGYAKEGYHCSADGTMCASDVALGQTYFCALHYRDAVLHAPSGRCCDSLSGGGACVGPRPAQVANPPYGKPDHHPALIVEGTVAYKNGPPPWNGTTHPAGAYGFTFLGGVLDSKTGACSPLPPQFDAARVRPLASRPAGIAAGGCFLACNMTEIEQGASDPCAAGSFYSPSAGHSTMRCFSGGPDWLNPHNTGVCAYNCTLRETKDLARYCTATTSGQMMKDCELTCTDSLM